MLGDKDHHCRVCGLEQREPPWGSDGKTPSFAVCACCGCEFGYEDATRENIRAMRKKWLASGHAWLNEKARPRDWDLATQLKGIPARYREI